MALLVSTVFVALLGCAQVHAEAARHLHQAPASCNNTQSGRWYVTDDQGMVCPRTSLNYATGCCTDGELHSCTSCEDRDKCCSRYERCVSCCLRPDNKPEEKMQSIFRGRNKPETGHWSTPFEYCQAVCRTTARSTQHENAFILDRRFCFSKLGRPQVEVPTAPELPKEASLVAGGAGQSCDVACGAKQMACRPDWFPSINDCNSLRAKFMCEAGCGSCAADQIEYPGYVEGSAPKNQQPALCVFLPPLAAQLPPAFNCSHSNASVRRLCPCEQLPPGAAATGGAGVTTAAGGATTTAGQQAAAASDVQAVQAAAAAQSAQAGGDQAAAAATQQQQQAVQTAAAQQQQQQQAAAGVGAGQAQQAAAVQVGQQQAGAVAQQ